DYQHTGGYLGNFLVQKIFLPVFGASHFGPYLISFLCLLFVVIWGFRMSVVAVSEKSAASVVMVVRPFSRGRAKVRQTAGPSEEEEADSEALATAVEIAKVRLAAKAERGRHMARLPIPDGRGPKPDPERKRTGGIPRTDSDADARFDEERMAAPPALRKAPVL